VTSSSRTRCSTTTASRTTAPPLHRRRGLDFDIPGFVEDADNRNLFDVDPKLGSIAWGSLDAAPAAGSPVLGAGQAVDGLEATDYLGAIKDAESDWTKGWTNWSPN
jgi:hypothetical protein